VVLLSYRQAISRCPERYFPVQLHALDRNKIPPGGLDAMTVSPWSPADNAQPYRQLV
jgi:hypothetical protein